MESVDGLIERYASETVRAIALLRENGLHSHALVQLYAGIDTLGLLAAPDSVSTANRATFTFWVERYLIGKPGIHFAPIDFYAARCSVLHTFTTQSMLSEERKAKELVYYLDSGSGKMDDFIDFAKRHEGGRFIPVEISRLEVAFLFALREFIAEMGTKPVSASLMTRLRGILQQHDVGDNRPSPNNSFKPNPPRSCKTPSGSSGGSA